MTEFDLAAKYRAGFTASKLGRIHTQLPLSDMASAIAVRFPKHTPKVRSLCSRQRVRSFLCSSSPIQVCQMMD